MRRLLTGLLLATLVAGCASLPPARPIADVRSLAGAWTGTMAIDGAAHEGVSTIEPDGRYTVLLPHRPPGRFTGVITVRDGQARYRSDTTGSTGTLTLHEDGGRRTLVWRADDGSSVARTTPRPAPDRVRLQLKWVTQAQFAGYYAARARGLYAVEGLDVTILPGGPDIAPEEVVARGGAEVGVGWLSSLLAARDRGLPLVNFAQVFGASAMRQIAFASSGIRGPADLRGRRVAVWFSGNEFPLLATLDKYDLDPKRDLTVVPQPVDMRLFLDRAVDAAAVTTYNEYRQVLDAGVRPEDLVVIDFNREGTAMLEDGLFATAAWLRTPGHRQLAARFLRASLRGWEFCRDQPAACVDLVLAEQPALGRAHQAWMMAEVNKLIWGPPAPAAPVGRMDPAAFRRTADIAHRFDVIRRPASAEAYTHEVWDLAHGR
jgi:NitT/TauT family transport system substrate-binding protein